MKNFIIVLGLLFCSSLFSQQIASKNDIVMTTDGQLLQVKVTKVTDNIVSFNYPGESVVNEIKSDGIDKIVFANGRTQNFDGRAAKMSTTEGNSPAENSPIQIEETIALPSYEENMMAIIPMKFTRNDTYDKTLSNDATNYLVGLTSKQTEAKGIKILEKDQAIEKLVDAGVNYEKLRKASPEELRGILGTEYLLYVSIDEREKGKDKADLDFMEESASVGDNSQLERTIGLRIYTADSEVEAFEIDFSENVFKRKTKNTNSSLLSDGKWKASLRYLVDQLFTANVFSN